MSKRRFKHQSDTIQTAKVSPSDRDLEGTIEYQAEVSKGFMTKKDPIKDMKHDPKYTRQKTLTTITNLLLPSHDQQQPINILRTSLNEVVEQVQYNWVLHPTSKVKSCWDLLTACVVIYHSWMVPFMLCFDWYEPSTRTSTMLILMDVWGFLDICLRFRTGIIVYGTVVMNPRVITKTYLHSFWLPIDIAATVPFEYLFQNSSSIKTRKTVKLLKYIKLPRLLRIGRFVEYVRKYKRYSSAAIALNLLMLAAHLVGCLWVAFVHPCYENLDHPQCGQDEIYSLYWVALHYALMSLLGISSDHIESKDHFLSGGRHYETIPSRIYIWSLTVSILGVVLIAILFGAVTSLVKSWQRAEEAFRKKLDQITHEMDALHLPKELRHRITAYYDYLWLNNRTFSDELNLLKDDGMSLALRQQIAVYLFKDNLQKIPFFQLATDDVLGMICMQLRQMIYMTNDYIIKEGEIGKELFMIVKGIVRIMPAKKENTVHDEEQRPIYLGEGEFFGEIGVVMEVERTRSVRAECMSELCILSRDGFEKILVEFPEFAVAMKRLLVKRIIDNFSRDDTKKSNNLVEKLTTIADYKMKKKVKTYNNIRKLQNKTKAMQAFHPRLSTLIVTPPPTNENMDKEVEEEIRCREPNLLAPIKEITVEEQTSSNAKELNQDLQALFTQPQKNKKERAIHNHAAPLSNDESQDVSDTSGHESVKFSPRDICKSSTATTANCIVREEDCHCEKSIRKFKKKMSNMEKLIDIKLEKLDSKLQLLLDQSNLHKVEQTSAIDQDIKF